MTEPDTLPQQPSEAHFDIPKKAAAALGAEIDGNRLSASQVRLGKHETVVHQLPGEIIAKILPDISKHDLKGKVPQGVPAADKSAVIAAAQQKGISLLEEELSQESILAQLQKQPGRGFAMDGVKFPLPMLRREDYSVVDKCGQCHGVAQMNCRTCDATGQKTCIPCHGHGVISCNACGATGMFQRPDGSRQPCNRCHGSGRAQCHHCQGRKTEPCPDCRATGHIGCDPCGNSGYMTHIYHAAWHAEVSFRLDRSLVPPDAQKALDIFGAKDMAKDGHAEIFLTEPVLDNGTLVFPCTAFLPVAQAEFSIEGKTTAALIAGLHGHIVEMEPVLDAIVKPGLVALSKLAKGASASTALLEQACKYRIVREALAGLAHHRKRAVYLSLKKKYAFSLSDKYARLAVKYADLALLALGDAPRKKGLIAGALLSAGLYAGYFMTGAHVTVIDFMSSRGMAKHMLLADAAVYALGFVVALFAIKFAAAGSLQKILPPNVRTKKELGLPAAGRQGWWALGICLLIWAGFAGAAKVEWLPIAAVSAPEAN